VRWRIQIDAFVDSSEWPEPVAVAEARALIRSFERDESVSSAAGDVEPVAESDRRPLRPPSLLPLHAALYAHEQDERSPRPYLTGIVNAAADLVYDALGLDITTDRLPPPP
jgi:hypothetical protein